MKEQKSEKEEEEGDARIEPWVNKEEKGMLYSKVPARQ